MLKLLLADNQAIFRAGAAKVLAVEDEWRVVAQTQTFEQTLMALEKFRPNIVIFAAALHSPTSDLTAASARFNARLIIVAENGESTSRYSSSGIHGLVFRSITGQALTECVRKISLGQTWVRACATA